MDSYIEQGDRKILREFAKRVSEIAAHPENNARKELWKKHNSLQKIRPMILVEYEWTGEIIPEKELETKSELARRYELQFRQIIYHWESFCDDDVVEPTVKVPLVCSITDWGLKVDKVQSSMPLGAWAYSPPLKEPVDFSKLRVPKIEVDEEKTRENYEIISQVIGDILPVKVHKHIPIGPGQHCIFADLRGLEQLMWDLHDRPQWVEEVMEFLTQGLMQLLRHTEKMGYLELNNTDGGMCYTDELPLPDFHPSHIRLKDLWGRGESQEFIGVSPEMFEKFLLRYQIQLLELFGLNDYGCCEPLTDRLELVKKIPRLRRINISPWTDLRVAAESLQDKYIFSWRVHPGIVSTEKFDTDYIRGYMQERLEIIKNCVVEIRLHGVRIVHNQPERLGIWSKITREVIDDVVVEHFT